MLKLLLLFGLLTICSTGARQTSKRKNPSFSSEDNDDVDTWKGLWFPHPPQPKDAIEEQPNETHLETDTTVTSVCDDGVSSIVNDFDPHDKRHSYNYLCLDIRTHYAPNMTRAAILTVRNIPPAYEGSGRCQNESLHYTERLPTFGPFRLLPPKYGEYQYIPPQRWMHALANGAIVFLYHPCAYAGQVALLRKILNGCLYRHIITPYPSLNVEHPMALLSWGKSLEISVVDEQMAIDFIKENAKHGPTDHQQIQQNNRKKKLTDITSKYYDGGLMSEAHLVSDLNDVEICGYKEM